MKIFLRNRIFPILIKSNKGVSDLQADTAHLAMENHRANTELVKHLDEMKKHLEELNELENTLYDELEQAESDQANNMIQGQLARLNQQRTKIQEQMEAARHRESTELKSIGHGE